MTDTAPAAGHRTRASSGGGVPGSRKRIRCAIYTRKSSEEGLEQEFNSRRPARGLRGLHQKPAP